MTRSNLRFLLTILMYTGAVVFLTPYITGRISRSVFILIAAGYFFDVCDYVILGSLIPDMTRSGFATACICATS